jgi:ligand-binding sensor protein/AraC-like DNA-binding protein
MSLPEIDIKSLLDISEWEKIQDQIAKLTGTAIITIDYKGTPVSKHSERTDFCTVIRENPVSRKRCYKCDSLAGLEAVRLNKPFIYLCHCGIVDVAVPVVVGDRYLGAVMFGQVRIPNDDTDAKVTRLVNEISSFQAEDQSAKADLLEMYNRLPEMEYRRIVEIADMLDSLVKYIVNRTLKSRSISLEYEYIINRASLPPMFDVEDAQADAKLREISSLAVPPRSSDYAAKQSDVPISSPVYPAVRYISEHRREMVGMKDMAELCHLSPSYFSKLFLKELGENYTDYINRKKVTWAKEALKNSDENVTRIAMSLGYQDTSYFVKVFKRYEGITPTVYRKIKRKR